MMKIIKPKEVEYVAIKDVPCGCVFMINESVYLRLIGSRFVNLGTYHISDVRDARTDQCARIVKLELKVSYE